MSAHKGFVSIIVVLIITIPFVLLYLVAWAPWMSYDVSRTKVLKSLDSSCRELTPSEYSPPPISPEMRQLTLSEQLGLLPPFGQETTLYVLCNDTSSENIYFVSFFGNVSLRESKPIPRGLLKEQPQNTIEKIDETANPDQIEENYPCGEINNKFFKINCPKNWTLNYIFNGKDKSGTIHNSIELISGNNSIQIDKPGFFDLASSDGIEKINVQFMNQKVESEKFNFLGEGTEKDKIMTWIINGFIEPTNDGNISERLNFNLRCNTKCDETTKREMLEILASFGGFKIE